MALSVGIVGLPNVGKSTLFNALSDKQAEAANYAFCTIDPTVGIVPYISLQLKAVATSFDVLLHYLAPRAKAAVYLLGDFCMLGMAILAVYTAIESLEISLKFGSVTHGLRISLAWFLAAVPLGFSLMIYRLGQSIWRDFGDLRSGRPVFEGKKMFD